MNINSIMSVVALAVLAGVGQCASAATSPVASVGEASPRLEKTSESPTLNLDSTIGGPDADGNGVRDDLDAYIAALADDNRQKSALRQLAASLRKAMLTDTANAGATTVSVSGISAAAACLFAHYESAVASKKSATIEKLAINTRTRFLAYEKFNAALNATSFVLPQGNGCRN